MPPAIHIDINTEYLADQSLPEANRFVFSYTITLSNQGEESAQLISRHWIITDAHNATQEVQGMGVVGQQPHLAPGQSYTYTSGVVLPTATGTMTGSYEMRSHSGETFQAPIPTFALIHPQSLH